MLPIESINFQMLNVGLAHHHGDWNWQNVSSPFTRIYLCTEGTAQLHLPDKIIDLRPNHLYLIPPYVRHSYECHGLFTHYYLHIFEGYKKETEVFDYYSFPSEVKSQDIDETLFANMCKAHPEAELPESNPMSYDNVTTLIDYTHRYNQMPLHKKMSLRGSILLLFSRFVEPAKPKIWTEDKRMLKAMDYIRDNIYSNINIDQLASIASVSKPYFIRCFTKTFGISPLQFINKKKVERAQLFLLTNDMPVNEIATRLGFDDNNYFIRLFKKSTGMTPMFYRNNMR